MRRQAERWGAELYQEDVESIDVKTRPFTVESSERKVKYYFAQVLVLNIFVICFNWVLSNFTEVAFMQCQK